MSLDTTLQSIDESCNDPFVAASAKGLLMGYAARWGSRMSDKTLLWCEQTLEAPLYNVETGKPSRTFSIAGKIDKLTSEPDGVVLYDHKTTSQKIADPDAVYWRTLQVDSQHQHYEILLHLNGVKVDRIVWDVVKKPTIRPSRIAKATRQYIVSNGEYCGLRVTPETRELMTKEERETPELYMLRVASECLDNPDEYFARRSVVRSRNELEEYAKELWMTADSIREARRNESHYRNAGACLTYGTPCQFLGICSGNDAPDSNNWKSKTQVHDELSLADFDRRVITNSRLRSFLTCRRKHLYEYELGIERIDAEDRESLLFGTVMHAALDTYWKLTCRTEEHENGDYRQTPAGSEPATVIANSQA